MTAIVHLKSDDDTHSSTFNYLRNTVPCGFRFCHGDYVVLRFCPKKVIFPRVSTTHR